MVVDVGALEDVEVECCFDEADDFEPKGLFALRLEDVVQLVASNAKNAKAALSGMWSKSFFTI